MHVISNESDHYEVKICKKIILSFMFKKVVSGLGFGSEVLKADPAK
jgi:hypothetical protein